MIAPILTVLLIVSGLAFLVLHPGNVAVCPGESVTLKRGQIAVVDPPTCHDWPGGKR